MARTNNLTNFLEDVAGAIKEKKGDNTDILASEFDTEILNLPSQGTYQQKQVQITSNGTTTVTSDSGYDAMTEVEITTQVPDKQLQTKNYEFTQNATLELIPDTGYDGFDKVGLTIDVGSPMDPTTANTSDVIYPKTFYSNGQKLIGDILPTYISGNPALIEGLNIPYDYALDDVDYKNGVGVRATSSSNVRVYKIKNNMFTGEYIDISASTAGVSSFVTTTSRVGSDIITSGSNRYVCIATACKNSSGYHGISIFRVDLDTFTSSDYKSSFPVSITSESTNLEAVPLYGNKFALVTGCRGYGSLEGYIYIFTHNGTSISSKKLLGVKNSGTSNSREWKGGIISFFVDNNTVTICAEAAGQRYGGYDTFTFIGSSTNGFSTFTTLYSNSTMLNPDGLKYYAMLDKNLVIKANEIYNISTSGIGTKVGTCPFTIDNTYRIQRVGSYLFVYTSSSSTTLTIYSLNDYTLTRVNTRTITSGAIFRKDPLDFLYVEGSAIIGYTVSGNGTLIALERIGDTFYRTADADIVASDVLNNKVGYGPIGKVTGTMPNNGALNYTPTTSTQSIPAGYTSGGTIDAVDNTIDENIVAENIKKNVSILGVTGTLEEGVLTQQEYDTCIDLADYIMYGGEPSLPYTELDYIQGTGTQYLTTNITVTSDTIVEIDGGFTEVPTVESYIFGGKTNGTGNGRCAAGTQYVSGTQPPFNWYIGMGGAYAISTLIDDQRHTIKLDFVERKYYFDGVAKSASTLTGGSYPLMLFAINTSNGALGISEAKIYSFKVQQGGEVVLDLIPVKRTSDDVVCMYDKVSEQFFLNQGTGVFTAGPEKEVNE